MKKIELPIFEDHKGRLMAIEHVSGKLPFLPKRTFFIFDVPLGEKRAGHATSGDHFILALRGSVTIQVVDKTGVRQKQILNKNNVGLHIPPLNYLELCDFSEHALLVVYSSQSYEETEYFSLAEVLQNE